MTVAAKMAEAKFFLELLDVLERRRVSLTNAASSSDEASFLLSAVLNSLYSALEQAKPLVGVDAVTAYKSVHSLIFKGNGGVRNITVYEWRVGADYIGYIPLPGNAVKLDLRPTPKLVEEAEAASPPGSVAVALGPDFYVKIDGALIESGDLCHKQYYALLNFFRTRELLPNNPFNSAAPCGAN